MNKTEFTVSAYYICTYMYMSIAFEHTHTYIYMRTCTPTHHNFPPSLFQAKHMQATECGRGHGTEPQPTEHYPA